MAERERIRLGDGVSIFRQHRTWILDLGRRGRRIRTSLVTPDKGRAITMAGEIMQAWDPRGRDIRLAKKTIQVAVRLLHGDPDLPPDEEVEAVRHRLPILVNRVTEALAGIAEGRRAEQGLGLKVLVAEAVRETLGLGEAIQPIDPRKATAGYLRYLRARGRAKAYVKVSVIEIKRFLAESGLEDLREATSELMVAHLGRLRARGLSPKTQKNYWDVVSGFLRWAASPKSGRLLKESPAEGLAPEAAPYRRPETFKPDEVEKILKKASEEDPRLAVACALAVYGGMERIEIFDVTWADLDLAGRRLRVYRPKIKREHELPLFDQLLPYLEALPGQREGRLFGALVDESALGKRVKRLMRRALGRPVARPLLRMRHTFCTALQANGVSPTVAAQWAGHSVAQQQKHYTGLIAIGEAPLKLTFKGRGLVASGV